MHSKSLQSLRLLVLFRVHAVAPPCSSAVSSRALNGHVEPHDYGRWCRLTCAHATCSTVVRLTLTQGEKLFTGHTCKRKLKTLWCGSLLFIQRAFNLSHRPKHGSQVSRFFRSLGVHLFVVDA